MKEALFESEGRTMTMDEIKRSDKAMLVPKDISSILGCDPYSINVQVKEDKARGVNSFPFPTMLIGTRVKVPRIPFIKAMEGNVE